MEKGWFLIENKSNIIFVVWIVHCRPNYCELIAKRKCVGCMGVTQATIQYHIGAGARKAFTIKIAAIDFNL